MGHSLPSRIALIPSWTTSTHQPIFAKICLEINATSVGLTFRQPVYQALGLPKPRVGFLRILGLWIEALFLLILKGDIRSLRFCDVNIGHGINETIIRKATYAHASPKHAWLLLDCLSKSCSDIILLKSLFATRTIVLVAGGDEAYLPFSYIAQLSNHYLCSSAFLRGSSTVYSYHYDIDNLTSSCPPTLAARLLFERLCPDEMSNWLASATKELEDRTTGTRSLDYMPQHVETSTTDNHTPQKAIWIYLHDFFDAPGVYGKNIFVSHAEWIYFTIRFCLRSSQPIVIKTHPNATTENRKVLEKLYKIYPSIHVYRDHTPLLSVKNAHCPIGIITVYGSVVTEAAFLGIPVITCGRSPYDDFYLSHRALSKKNYKNLLLRMIKQELWIQKSNTAVMSLASLRYYDFTRSIGDLPFNDINLEQWSEIFSNVPYPTSGIMDRRDVILDSDKVRRYVENRLSSMNLSSRIHATL